MRRRARLATIAAISMPVIGLGASPAGAASESGTANVTFHDQGKEVTCSIEGSTSVDYVPSRDASDMHASTRLASGSDPECASLMLFMTATGYYRVEGRTEEESFGASSQETAAVASAVVSGVVVDLRGLHRAEFRCDEGPMRCVATFLTNPK
jgi:hypothetical protein